MRAVNEADTRQILAMCTGFRIFGISLMIVYQILKADNCNRSASDITISLPRFERRERAALGYDLFHRPVG